MNFEWPRIYFWKSLILTLKSSHLSKTEYHQPKPRLTCAGRTPYPNVKPSDLLPPPRDSSHPVPDVPSRPSSHQKAYSLCCGPRVDCCQKQTHQDSAPQYLTPASAPEMPVPAWRSPLPPYLRGKPGVYPR